ncbi:hypothetical protein SAMN04490179_4366 [Pseudomonas antarctica]|uniref:Uncharacterized protein n=1 Tax=Pseudomonas antarctica TaxID=219572 RepID=A0A1H0BLN8_9PSED|nr:hypothetical protein [Pseudomonas antarctica]KAF2406530.1 hypothetical protein PSAN_47060 [Pseudomonas antarctica]SDN46522.1 hypothetical protein SAMN04490179_4366 [Pseudomonas antarctica]
MSGDNTLLQGLYYPFSRCMDSCALKQLMLVFDAVTFLEPVKDAKWRAGLFRNLETNEDPRFSKYRGLEHDLKTLEQEGALSFVDPQSLAAFKRPETSLAAISDLQDPLWCKMASNPSVFGLPHQRQADTQQPTWQMFAQKIPMEFRHFLGTDTAREHLINEADDHYAWTLSYAAGSAATLNFHLAAAADLGLSPITDSELHHRLLLRKATRALTPDSEWTDPVSTQLSQSATSTAVKLLESLMPHQALESASFDKILRFRENTRGDRAALVNELTARLIQISNTTSYAELSRSQIALSIEISKEVREYQAAIGAARDKLWPNLVKGLGLTFATGTSAALLYEYLLGGPMGVLTGALSGVAYSSLAHVLDSRAEKRQAVRAANPSIAYLSRVSQLK